MRLLVSVRVPEEVEAALDGGADIIDAKEPSRGSLGAVAPEVLARIAERVQAPVSLSIALGDATDGEHLTRLIACTGISRRPAETFVKVGFRHRPVRALTSMMRAGLGAAADIGVILVPVAYADHVRAGSPRPDEVLDAAATVGARAILVDTYLKDGRSLLHWIDPAGLAGLGNRARGAGMMFALAGGLESAELEAVAEVADVVGVRGAACRGGREGVVDAALVRGLRDRLSRSEPALSPRP